MWLGLVIIGQFIAALVCAFVINMIWVLTNPGQGLFGKANK
jgi:hypothetical protein